LPPLPVELVAGLAQGRPIAKAELDELRARVAELERQRTAHLGVMAGIDPNDLAQAGWGVIFAQEDQAQLPALRERLAPLLNLRRQQAGDRYRDETVNADFLYQPGESMNAWRSRNHGAPGKVDPRRLPYYLLIVGDPQRIPFDFQYQLDVRWGASTSTPWTSTTATRPAWPRPRTPPSRWPWRAARPSSACATPST